MGQIPLNVAGLGIGIISNPYLVLKIHVLTIAARRAFAANFKPIRTGVVQLRPLKLTVAGQQRGTAARLRVGRHRLLRSEPRRERSL